MTLVSILKRWLSRLRASAAPVRRDLELRFDLPYLRSDEKSTLPLTATVLAKEWQKYADNNLLFLEHVADYLDLLNHARVAPRTRLKLLEYTLKSIYPYLAAVFQRQDIEQSFPESDERRWGLASALTVVQQLVMGYKHLFAEDYQTSDKVYRRVRERLRLCGIRILELTCTEQRLAALRYQKLPRQAWRECNQVFFILSRCENADATYRLAGWLRLPVTSNQQEGMASARQLYIALQLFGIVDTLSWPSRFISVLDSYLRQCEASIVLKADATGVLPGGHVVCYYDFGAPGQFSRTQPERESILMDIRPLLDKLGKDNFYLSDRSTEQKIKNLSMPLAQLQESEQRIFLEMLGRRLLQHTRREERAYIGAHRELDIFFGYMEAYKHIQKSVSERLGSSAGLAQRSLEDILAGRTSALMDDSRHCRNDQWYVIDESPGGIRLRTNESRYTTPMVHGQLVALEMPLPEATSSFQVGYVCRLQRPEKDEVEVTIIRLSDAIECVGIQDELMRRQGQAIPAFLLDEHGAEPKLIFHSRQQRTPGEHLVIHGRDSGKDIVLGDIILIQQEFSVFTISQLSSD